MGLPARDTSMHETPDEYEDAAAALYIPEDADTEVVREMIQAGYESVEDEYTRLDAEEMPDDVARKGSLCQELLAQLDDQT